MVKSTMIFAFIAGVAFGGVTPQSAYGENAYETPSPATSTDAYQTPSVAPAGYGSDRPKGCKAKGNSTNCPAGLSYAAILYEQDNFAGLKHTIDGTNGECRGLSGVDVQSVRYLSAPGADEITGAATEEFARGVTLTFFNDFACNGTSSEGFVGTQKDMAAKNVRPKSVRIACNGQGSSSNGTAPVSDVFTVQMFEQEGFQGIAHQTDAHHFECRGLEGSSVASLRFLESPGSTNVVQDADAKKSKLVFYDGTGCTGKKLAQVVGNHAKGLGFNPRSVLFLAPDVADSRFEAQESAAVKQTHIGAAAALLATVAAFLV